MQRGRAGHPLFARLYARLSPAMERGIAQHRRRLVAGLRGTVIEIGAGDGMNFGHYPPEVERVMAVEPEPYLRDLARCRARHVSASVEVVDGVAEVLPLADGSADAAVASLVLCSVADLDQALAELFRVVRPGGELRVFEHVRAASPVLRAVQRLLDATLWPVIAGGCHTSRHTAAAIQRAGFTSTRFRLVRFPDFRLPLPTSPHILGAASRPFAAPTSLAIDDLATARGRLHASEPAAVGQAPGQRAV